MEWITSPEIWLAFFTLLLLEIVLGIDNIVFISILSGKLPEHQQARGRTVGLLGALVTRILLLFSLSWVIGLTAPFFTVLRQEISGRDLVLIVGGFFLLVKSTMEIHERMVDELAVMVAAVVAAVGIMLILAEPISSFVNNHPTVKMLALSFLLLIGATLIAEGFDQHIPKGYVYGPIAFSVFVEMLNLRVRSRMKEIPVHLRPMYVKEGRKPGVEPPVRPSEANGIRPGGGPRASAEEVGVAPPRQEP